MAEGGEEGGEVFLGLLFGFPRVRIHVSLSEEEALLEEEKKRKEKKRKEKKGVECIENDTKTYVEYRLGLRPAGVCVLLAERDELFGEALRFLGLVPGRLDGFVRDERGDEVAEEGLPVRGGAVQVPVFHGTAGHCEM